MFSKLLFIDKVKLQEELGWVIRRYKALREKGEIDGAKSSVEDSKKWAFVLELLQKNDKGQSLLDVGSGAGQFINAAAKSGFFAKVTGFDRAADPSFRELTKNCKFVLKSIVMPQVVKYRADVVTCLDTLAYIKSKDLPVVIANLKFLAKRRLIVTVPFMQETPLPKGQLQFFDEARLLELFPNADITYLAKGHKITTACIDLKI